MNAQKRLRAAVHHLIGNTKPFGIGQQRVFVKQSDLRRVVRALDEADREAEGEGGAGPR